MKMQSSFKMIIFSKLNTDSSLSISNQHGLILILEKNNNQYRFIIELYPEEYNIKVNLYTEFFILPKYDVNFIHLQSFNNNTINDFEIIFNLFK